MLPRRPAKVRSGRSQASWARRRTEPVATGAPGLAGRPGGIRPGRHGGRPGRRRPPGPGPSGVARRQVLGRVDGEVGPAVEHGGLHLLDEHALAAQLPDRDVLALVAGGRRPRPARRRARARRTAGRGPPPRPATGPARCPGWRSAALPAPAVGPTVGGQVSRSNSCRRPWASCSPVGRAGPGLDVDGRLVEQLGHDAPGEGLDRRGLGRRRGRPGGCGSGSARRRGWPRPARAGRRPGGPHGAGRPRPV